MANKMEKILGITAGALLLVGLPTGLAAKEDVRVKGISQVQAPVEAAQEEKQPEFLSLDEAKQIAFDHAGVNGEDAHFDDEELDKHDKLYELEFHVDGVEYEYDIQAVTGKILEAEHDDRKENRSEKNTTKPDPETFISLDEAKQIAFGHAGVSGKDARFDDEELDKHDQLYELEFHVDGVEYEYDIHAVTKKVLKFERDNGAAKASSKTQSKTTKPAVSEKKETKTADNNDEPKQKKQTEAPKKQVNASETNTAPAKGETKKKTSTKTVTKEQAVQIALKHAGVSVSDVTFDDVELDDDDGRKHYEIEFNSATHEYEYDIDAATGKILDHEIEQDD